MEIIMSDYFLPAIKNAALKLDEKRELAFLEKPFDGFYVTFADQNIDKEKFIRLSSPKI